jgi:hypothetical protein
MSSQRVAGLTVYSHGLLLDGNTVGEEFYDKIGGFAEVELLLEKGDITPEEAVSLREQVDASDMPRDLGFDPSDATTWLNYEEPKGPTVFSEGLKETVH